MNLAEFRSDVHYLGFSRALARGIYYRANRVITFRHYRLLRNDLSMAPDTVELPGSDFDWIMLDAKQATQYAQQLASELDDGFLREAAEAGYRCLLILDGRQAASIGWYGEGSVPLRRSVRVSIPKGCAYMFRGYTPPGYRGRGLHRIGLLLAAKWHAERGVRGLFTVAESVNYASLKNAKATGYRECGSAYEFGSTNKTFTFNTAAARETGFVVATSP